MVNIYRYIGVVHVHTSFSDGTGGMEEIMEAAQFAGLDFIIVTDHNDLRAKLFEGWRGRTLLLAGEEVTRPEGNHMLAMGIKELIPPHTSPQEGINLTKKQGGLAFLLHPFYQGSSIINDPPLPWLDWGVVGFDGIEIWNLTADLYQRLDSMSFGKPPKDILNYAAPNPKTLRKWDELLAQQKIVGLGGLDAHAERVVKWGKVVLPYAKAFSALRLHLFLREPLTGDLEQDRRLVYAGIGSGNFWVSLDWLYSSTEVDVEAHCGEDVNLLPGEESRDDSLMLRIELPIRSVIRVIYQGEEFLRTETRDFRAKLKMPGYYRLEIYYNGRPWILTNPYYVKKPANNSLMKQITKSVT